MPSTRLRAFATAGFTILAACGDVSRAVDPPRGAGAPSGDAGSTATSGVPTTSEVNEAVVLGSVADGAYKFSPQFVPVNRVAYASTAASGIEINVWATSADIASYAEIAPEQSGSHVDLNPGAMIVREVSKNGAVVKLTLMVKGPPGYNPDLGDFWFGVTDPYGVPLVENGAKLTGKLSQCYSCHIPRKDDGYLFGVSEAARSWGTSDGGAGTSDATAPPASLPPAPTPPPVPPPQPPGPVAVCGDFYCDVGESCANCPSDCGSCQLPPATAGCGDGLCEAGESCATCPWDCGSCEVEGGGEDH